MPDRRNGVIQIGLIPSRVPPKADRIKMRQETVIRHGEDGFAARNAGRLAAAVLDMITPHVVAGVTTDELDRLCHDILAHGAVQRR